jgi:hypothetical protein
MQEKATGVVLHSVGDFLDAGSGVEAFKLTNLFTESSLRQGHVHENSCTTAFLSGTRTAI